MIKTLVVALDLEADGDRALPVVQAIARTGPVGVELVTVSSPGLPPEPDLSELQRRARSYGWSPDACVVLHDPDPAIGLLQHLAHRPNGLLVMATSARRPWASAMLGSVPHDVLRVSDRPVLLIGPRVEIEPTPCTTLVPCVDPTDMAERALPAIVSWQETFACAPPQIAEIVRDDAEVTAARQRTEAFAALLAAQHVHATPRVVVDTHPVAGLEALTDHYLGAVYVATSARFTDGRMHWHSTTQQLVNRATRPVLVVPARPMAATLPVEAPELVEVPLLADGNMLIARSRDR